jgi:tRNA (cmo5U34)-methyltransferase
MDTFSEPAASKSTTEEIERRFDADVERFSNLETGQTATVDAPLAMELITQAAAAATPVIRRVLDIGCGAGNNTIRLLQVYERPFACDLCDLSRNMLERARIRVTTAGAASVRTLKGDFRTLPMDDAAYDVVLAAAVLHHLRDDRDWETVFAKVFRILKPGGSFWITDLIAHENPRVQALIWRRYGAYLEKIGGAEYRDRVFAYIDKEDSPRPLSYQLDLLRRVGFRTVDVLHKHLCFAAFGAVKAE